MAERSARAWLRALDGGECSAVELARHYLRRLDDVSGLNAVIAWDPDQVLEDAAAQDAARRNGRAGPLCGLPITVKDSLDVAGWPATGGSAARAGHRPKRDATSVARLRAAGAVVLAKTNLPEYSAAYETDNAICGRTRNPHDAARTPGGSSGGEAAVLGADASPVGIGADGGGSIRVPAHYCGIVGLRPTVGRVPETGHWPSTRASGMRDLYCIGPMGRYVEDLSLILDVIAGPDGIDPYAVPVPLQPPQGIAVDKFNAAVLSGPSVAACTDGTREALYRAAERLSSLGAIVDDLLPVAPHRATELFFRLVTADGGEQVRRDTAAAGGRHLDLFRSFLNDHGPPLDAPSYFELEGELFELRRSLRQQLGAFDVVLAPVVTGPAPLHGERPAGNPADAPPYAAFDFVHAFAVAGLPVAVVPMGEEGGMPIGVQVVGRPYAEHDVLAAAECLRASHRA